MHYRIGALAEEKQKDKSLADSVDKTCIRYKIEISAEKTKLMTKSAGGIQREIKIKGQNLGFVAGFKRLRLWLKTRGSLKDCILQPLQSGSQFGKITTYLLDHR